VYRKEIYASKDTFQNTGDNLKHDKKQDKKRKKLAKANVDVDTKVKDAKWVPPSTDLAQNKDHVPAPSIQHPATSFLISSPQRKYAGKRYGLKEGSQHRRKQIGFF
jgi:hypothetical protein